MKGKHAGKIAHHDEGDRAVVYLGEPIHSGYVLIEWGHLANVTSPSGGSGRIPFFWGRRPGPTRPPRRARTQA